MTTEYTGFFDDTSHRVVDGNIVYAKDLNNPLAALNAGITALVNAIQTGSTVMTAVDTGIVNAYVLNPTASITEYSDGQMVWLKPVTTNDGASTINISSLGEKNIRTTVRTALVGGELISGYWHMLKYSSSLDAFVIVSEKGITSLDSDQTVVGGDGIEASTIDGEITISIVDGGVTTEKLTDEAVTRDKIDSSVIFGPIAVQVFTASGTYTKTSGATVAIVEVVGGGGEGANGDTYASGGGGGGGYARKRLSLIAVGCSICAN